MNNDVLSEILLCLPVQSLLRFRAVCKTWGNAIDSQSFRKLHTHNNDSNKSDDMVYLQLIRFSELDKVYLQVTFVNAGNRVEKELSIKLQNNWYSQLAYDFDDQFNDFSPRLVDAVKGLICFNSTELRVPIAICNPFLGELKPLPLTPSNPSNYSCKICRRVVAIGFDEDYKVVQLLSCFRHHYLHAQVYSKSTDSWRELADVVINDVDFQLVSPIKSGCANGYFAHWYAFVKKAGGDFVQKILSFDMKNEVFREITLPKEYTYIYTNIDGRTRTRTYVSQIFAEEEHLFRLFDFQIPEGDNLVKIYESRCAGSELSWKHVMNVRVPLSGSEVPLCRTCCVFFVHKSGVFVYDYSARKFICMHSVSDFMYACRRVIAMDGIVECKGGFVSL